MARSVRAFLLSNKEQYINAMFIHSWIGWREQIYLLSELGYRVIVPSLRGFGETVSLRFMQPEYLYLKRRLL